MVSSQCALFRLELDLLEEPRELSALLRKAELVWPVHAGALLIWFPATTHLPKEFCVHFNSASEALNSSCFS